MRRRQSHFMLCSIKISIFHVALLRICDKRKEANMSKKSWIPEIQFCNWIWMSTIHALTNSQDIYVISHMNRKENGWNKICNFINAFSQLCQISVVISFMKAEVLFAFLEKTCTRKISMWGTIHLRRRQIFTIFDPYPAIIGIPAKCLQRGFLILMCCDLWTIST